MNPVVFSVSSAFEQYLGSHLETKFEFHRGLQAPAEEPGQVYLLHISGMELDCYEWLLKHVSGKPTPVAVCSDLPGISEMLECVRLGAKAYCNSHMAPNYYRQMLRLLNQGQSWFPPNLLEETFRLAQKAAKPPQSEQLLQTLTEREKEIALAVSEGRSNRQIADLHQISEATVKSHLSSVFKKLEVSDRVGLVLLMKQG